MPDVIAQVDEKRLELYNAYLVAVLKEGNHEAKPPGSFGIVVRLDFGGKDKILDAIIKKFQENAVRIVPARVAKDGNRAVIDACLVFDVSGVTT